VRGGRGEGWQAHSVRRESCNSDSSPEPSAAGSEGREAGWVRGEPRTGFCVIVLGTGGAASGSRHAPDIDRSSVRDGGVLGEWACWEGRRLVGCRGRECPLSVGVFGGGWLGLGGWGRVDSW